MIVNWDTELFGLASNLTGSFTSTVLSRAAQINYFCKHNIEFESKTKTHLLVSLSWFKPHTRNTDFGKPLGVWYHDLFELRGVHSVIPVQFLESRCVSLIDNLDGESVLFVCACMDFE